MPKTDKLHHQRRVLTSWTKRDMTCNGHTVQYSTYSSSVSDGDLVASNLELQYLEYPLERVHVHSKKSAGKTFSPLLQVVEFGESWNCPAQGESLEITVTPVWFPEANSIWFFEETSPCAVSFQALDATAEFITLNERLCSRPHSITHEPDDKLHHPPWLPDLKGCLINQRLDMAPISRGSSGQGCPGHILTPTHHYLAIFPAPSPWQVWIYRIRTGRGRDIFMTSWGLLPTLTAVWMWNSIRLGYE